MFLSHIVCGNYSTPATGRPLFGIILMAESVYDIIAKFSFQVQSDPVKLMIAELNKLMSLEKQRSTSTRSTSNEIKGILKEEATNREKTNRENVRNAQRAEKEQVQARKLAAKEINAINKEIERNLQKSLKESIKLQQEEQAQLELLEDDYKLLGLALKDAEDKARKFTFALGANHPVAIQAANDALNIRNSLIKVDRSLGDSRRQVGNYQIVVDGLTKSNGNLSFAFSQLLREAPAFTYSFQTGLLALSNNIPILLDQLKQARASGTTTTGIFKALGSSLFSLTGIITIGVAALTIFGDKLFDTEKKTKSAKEEMDDYTQAIINNTKAATDATTREGNRRDIGVNAAERQLELLKAQGASDAKILAQQKIVADLRKREFQNELDRFDIIESRTRELFNFFGGAFPSLKFDEIRKQVIPELTKTLQETLDLSKDEATKEAEAIANSYSTRESIIRQFIPRKRELEEKIKDETGSVIREETRIFKKESDEKLKLQKEYNDKRLELMRLFRESLRDMRNETELTENPFGRTDLDTDSLFPEVSPDELRKSGIFEGKVTSSFMTPAQKARFEVEQDLKKKQKEEDRKATEERKKNLDLQVQYYQDAAFKIIQTFENIYNARLKMLDREIQTVENRVTRATILAERGNLEILNAETETLEKLQAERERVAQKQLQLNALLQASSAALTLANSIEAVSKAAAQGGVLAPVTIAATVAALASGFALIANLANAFKPQGFKHGGFTGEGNENEPAGTVHKGEFVFTKKRTKEIGIDKLEALHKGRELSMSALTPNEGYARKDELKGVINKLSDVEDAIKSIRLVGKQTIDKDGAAQFFETTAKRARNKWL